MKLCFHKTVQKLAHFDVSHTAALSVRLSVVSALITIVATIGE